MTAAFSPGSYSMRCVVRLIALWSPLVLTAACVPMHNPAPSAATPVASVPPGPPHMDMCPLHVAGAQVIVTDVDGGVALTFTTPSDVEELRARVHHMTDMHAMHDMHRLHGDMAHGHMGARPGVAMRMVPVDASAQDIDGGTRVVLTPIDPAQVDALRAEARAHAEMMHEGDCTDALP